MRAVNKREPNTAARDASEPESRVLVEEIEPWLGSNLADEPALLTRKSYKLTDPEDPVRVMYVLIWRIYPKRKIVTFPKFAS